MPDALTGSRLFDLVLWLASVLTAVGIIGGVIWWLIKPRVLEFAADLLRGVGRVEEQLVGDEPDTVSRYARVAAGKASAIEEQLAAIAKEQEEARGWRTRFETRLGVVEGTLLALLGPELRRRLAADLQEQDTYREEDKR